MIRELFDRLRHDPKHHEGLGDIRLTIAQQDDIAAQVDRIRASNAELLAALQVIVANATLTPDPKMDGATDHYAVPLDDIDAARAAVAKATGRGDTQ